jgi:hypothetical protein
MVLVTVAAQCGLAVLRGITDIVGASAVGLGARAMRNGMFDREMAAAGSGTFSCPTILLASTVRYCTLPPSWTIPGETVSK